MADKVFVDTNVFVYAADASEPTKQARARALVLRIGEAGGGVISSQVLGEFYVAATRKLGLAARDARTMVSAMAQSDVVSVDATLVSEAMACAELDQIAYYDALIVVAAARARCRTLYTEDLNAGHVIRGVRVVNPFAD
ncbi:MAG: PIN domain-containing protein [Armatimonadetes bacterium]|nr:PIN domain-containing protein [Armatimonadota bacterium]